MNYRELTRVPTGSNYRSRVYLIVSALLASTSASAVTIEYSLIKLGGNDYRYEYTVSNDGSLGAGIAIELFDVFFDPGLYDESSLNIVTPTPPADSWDEILLASAPGQPAAYDALALAGGIAAGTSLGVFTVEFTWLGSGIPGGQVFEIYDPHTFDLRESGFTANSVVPLPASMWLLLSGLLALFGLDRTSGRCYTVN